jgi:ubiquinone/menaquinone biosynthesis C-methylase UbiE
MAQEKVWEKEYRNPIMVTKYEKPQADTLRFFKYLKKNTTIELDKATALDLGSGTGRNANYLAQKGSMVVGIEISDTAINLATKRSVDFKNKPKYYKQSMGSKWPVGDSSVDIVLDVLSSNCLNESERIVYLAELSRVMKPGAMLFVKTLCKDGDKNAHNLLEKFPGSEKDTYVMPDLGLTERVFTEKDFREVYGDFHILSLEKKTSHIPFNGQIFTRRFIVAYLKKAL